MSLRPPQPSNSVSRSGRPHGQPLLAEPLLAEIERRKPGLARHMRRAVTRVVRWDTATEHPPNPEAIYRACEAGLDLFLTTAREGRRASPEQMRRVAQLGVLQARSADTVEPVLAAYRLAAKVAWNAILRAWRGYPGGSSPEAMVELANYVFAALDQVAAEVTSSYLATRETQARRGSRARARLFHALISDTFGSEMAVQKQALALGLHLAPGYIAAVCTLSGEAQASPTLAAALEGGRGGEVLLEMLATQQLPSRTLTHAPEPTTLVVLWPVDSRAGRQGPRGLISQLDQEARQRWPGWKVRCGLGSHHTGLQGVSRSYLEALEALELGRKLRPGETVHEYDDLLPYLVLSQNVVLTERFVRHHLGPLLDLDKRRRESMLETLDAYLATGSIKGAAERLHLHRHSVLYRLDRIRELLGEGFDRPPARHGLHLAVDLLRLL